MLPNLILISINARLVMVWDIGKEQEEKKMNVKSATAPGRKDDVNFVKNQITYEI
ncbi:MAG: hypothetical protein ACI8P3_003212 [Saprospiraceae bacterium]